MHLGRCQRNSLAEWAEATPEHPFFVQGKGFRAAKMLAAGALVATLGASVVQVVAVEEVRQAKPVYNFAVENTQTYFVGRSKLWVHNQCSLQNKLRVFSNWRSALSVVRRNDLSADEYIVAKMASSLRGGAHFEGQKPFNLAGIDGWWGSVGGKPISIKEVTTNSPLGVHERAKVARNLADQHGYRGQGVDVYINAPLVDMKDLLTFIEKAPGRGIDSIPKPGGTVGRITVFCKDNMLLELTP